MTVIFYKYYINITTILTMQFSVDIIADVKKRTGSRGDVSGSGQFVITGK